MYCSDFNCRKSINTGIQWCLGPLFWDTGSGFSRLSKLFEFNYSLGWSFSEGLDCLFYCCLFSKGTPPPKFEATWTKGSNSTSFWTRYSKPSYLQRKRGSTPPPPTMEEKRRSQLYLPLCQPRATFPRPLPEKFKESMKNMMMVSAWLWKTTQIFQGLEFCNA